MPQQIERMDPARTVLIIVDMENDFVKPGASFEVQAGREMLPKLKELIAFCRDKIAGYKVPKGIDFWDEPLPISGPGKILKRELRKPYWEGRKRQIS